MVNLSRRQFLSSISMTIATGGLAGMSLSEAMAQPIERLAENVPMTILGRTGFKTKILGFGTMLIRGDHKESERIFNTAVDLGINVFETGRTYSDVEARLSGLIAKHRDKLYISSKTHKRDKAGTLKDIEKSLATLKTDHIDQYGQHDIGSLVEFERAMGKDGSIEALKQAQKEGKIRFIGMTSHSVPATMAGLRSGEFDVHVFPYNPVVREFERALNLATKLDVAVQIMKPLGGGNGNVVNYDPEDRGQLHETISAEECLKFELSHPGVTMLIPGMTSVEDVKKNLAILATFEPLTQDERRDIIAKADRIAGGVCGLCEGKPCEKVCPNHVPISFLVSSLQYIHKFGFDNRRVGELYAVQPHDYLDCKGCGECEKVCPQKFDIRNNIKNAHRGISDQRIRHALRKYGAYYISWSNLLKGIPED